MARGTISASAARVNILVSRNATSDPWRNELRVFVRALSGAFLFGIPLLYTMEMWWLGEISRPGHTLLVILVTVIANGMLVVAAGKPTDPLLVKAEQAILNIAVGIIGSGVVLVTLNQLAPGDSLTTVVGMISAQTLPLSIGAAVGDILFGGDREGEQERGGSPRGFWHALVNDVSATAIGAIFVAATVAPTEEVPMIAAGMDYPHLLALIGLTLLSGYIIVFASGFDPSAHLDREHLFQHPATETVLAYLVALIVSLGVLLLTHQVTLADPAHFTLTQTLVLGLPAMIGGAAGRIAI